MSGTEYRLHYIVYLHEVQAYDWSDLPTSSSAPKTYQSQTDLHHASYLYDKNTPDIIHTLYDTAENEEDFILNGKLNLEINKAGSFEFDILPSHSCYSMLRPFIQYVRVSSYNRREGNWSYYEHEYEKIQFYGRINSITVDISGTKHVTCEGLLSNLLDIPMYFPTAPDVQSLYTNRINKNVNGDKTEYQHQDIRVCVRDVLESYFNNIRKDIFPVIGIDSDASFPSDPSYTGDNAEVDWSSGSSICDVLFDAYVKTYGGYIYMNYYCDSHGDVLGQICYAQDTASDYSPSRTLTFGDNILDITLEHEGEVCTAIIPIWRTPRKLKEDNTYEEQEKRWGAISGKPNRIYYFEPQPTIMPQLCGYVGEQTVGAKMLDLPDVTNQNTALQIANKYFNENCKTDFDVQYNSITVKFIDDAYYSSDRLYPISLFKSARIISETHGIDVILPCLAIEINLDNPLENSYTFKKLSALDNSTALVISRRLQT